MIDQVTNAGAMPTLEAMMRFSGQRQRVLAHNIANVSTPNFVQKDLSVDGFQAALREAVEARRSRTGGMHGELRLGKTEEMAPGRNGEIRFEATTDGHGVLFHDRNNREIERLMQDLVENVAAFRTASELYRAQSDQLRLAMSERVA